MPLDGVRRIDHIAIAVLDLDAALAVYRDTLGIAPSLISDVPTEGVRIAFLPLGGPDGTKIELIQPLDPANSIGRFLAKHGEGQHHICLEVTDIDAALAQLQAVGAPVLDDIPRVSAEGRAVFIHPKGTHGVLLELVQPDSAT
jgi:methylmalonyl-CoA epimerase